MPSSDDLNKILNQIMKENRAFKLLLASVLRDTSIEKLNQYILETEVRVNLAVNNDRDHESKRAIQISGDEAISMLRTLIAEKSASL